MTHSARVHVLISPDEATRFEAYCKDRGFKKSTLVARLIKEHLDREGFGVQRDMFERTGEKGRSKP